MSTLTNHHRADNSLHLIINDILPHLRGVRQGRSSTHWTFFCPLAHRKKNASAAIWIDDEGWIKVHCFDCQRNAELRESVVEPALRGRPQPARQPGSSKAQNPPQNPPRYNPAPEIWGKTEPIPLASHHARRWLDHRNLWRPMLAVPAALRWLSAHNTLPGPHTGAGSIVALLAPPEAWETAWPSNPLVAAVEIIAIDAGGNPALDRPAEKGGLGKRTLGNKAGCILVVGNPRLAEADRPVRVSEGVADALALASRFPGPVVATMGDAGMKGRELAAWLAHANEGVIIHADKDGPGQAAAEQLRLTILALGGQARGVLTGHGKDAADTASALPPLRNPRENWPSFAESLAEMYGWPRWEAERQAAILIEDEDVA